MTQEELLNSNSSAIVSSGTNAKGSWILFSDGTLMQYGSVDDVNLGSTSYTVDLPFEYEEFNTYAVTITVGASYVNLDPNQSMGILAHAYERGYFLINTRGYGVGNHKVNWSTIGKGFPPNVYP